MIRKLKIIVVTLALGIIALMAYWPFSPLGRQLRSRERARGQIEAQAALLARWQADPRFSEISTDVGTQDDGVIVLRGYLARAEDLTKLKEIWESTHPPVKTLYFVTVLPEPFFSQEKNTRSSSVVREESH